MTSQGMKRAVNFGLCGHGAGKYFKMATVESECYEVLSCLLEAIQTNEDPSSFENSCTGPQRLDNPQNQCFLCQILRGKVGVLHPLENV